MASDGYLLVKSTTSDEWYVGSRDGERALWSDTRASARRFESQAEFRSYFDRTFRVRYKDSWGYLGCVRFVRVRPRKKVV